MHYSVFHPQTNFCWCHQGVCHPDPWHLLWPSYIAHQQRLLWSCGGHQYNPSGGEDETLSQDTGRAKKTTFVLHKHVIDVCFVCSETSCLYLDKEIIEMATLCCFEEPVFQEAVMFDILFVINVLWVSKSFSQVVFSMSLSPGYWHLHDPCRGHPQNSQRRVCVISVQPCALVTNGVHHPLCAFTPNKRRIPQPKHNH